jgi:hypothetical protein
MSMLNWIEFCKNYNPQNSQDNKEVLISSDTFESFEKNVISMWMQ